MAIGIAISGGGTRGAAHLGVIKALEEAGVTFSAISGTSAGAIVGALYSYGYSIPEILQVLKEIKVYKLIKPALSWKGILKMDTVYKQLEKYLPERSFTALKVPLHIAATNLKTGKTDFFDQGDLVGALCASSCIPVLFDPVSYNGGSYIDGGILCNLPVQPLKNSCRYIIGSHCNPVDEDFTATNARRVLERTMLLAISCNVYNKRSECDIFIEPKGIEKYKVLDLSTIDKVFQLGYEEGVRQIEAASHIIQRMKDEL